MVHADVLDVHLGVRSVGQQLGQLAGPVRNHDGNGRPPYERGERVPEQDARPV